MQPKINLRVIYVNYSSLWTEVGPEMEGMGFASKTIGKTHKVLLTKPKQICVKLHRYK